MEIESEDRRKSGLKAPKVDITITPNGVSFIDVYVPSRPPTFPGSVSCSSLFLHHLKVMFSLPNLFSKQGKILGDFAISFISYVQAGDNSADVMAFIARDSQGSREHRIYVFKSEQRDKLVTEITLAFNVCWQAAPLQTLMLHVIELGLLFRARQVAM